MTIFTKIGGASYPATEYGPPTERVFRTAWETDGGASGIYVNMAVARDIWRDKIRRARSGPLVVLDTAFMRALEQGVDTAEIVSAKQELRDAPADPNIDVADTPEELMAVNPAGLKIV